MGLCRELCGRIVSDLKVFVVFSVSGRVAIDLKNVGVS